LTICLVAIETGLDRDAVERGADCLSFDLEREQLAKHKAPHRVSTLTAIHVEERGKPKNRKKIEWRLITDLPVQSRNRRYRKARVVCFEMEDLHKILKSGCRTEEPKLRMCNA
jgi:hypothetical protein